MAGTGLTLPPHVAQLFVGKARWGVGVSGGGDSVALLCRLVSAGFGGRVCVLHFNHKWGAFGGKAEAFVKTLAKTHKLEIAVGQGKGKAKTNAEAKARGARLAFFKTECKKRKLAGVMLAHTRDDDVETFLMRLARGSGLRGLVGMEADTMVGGVRIVRPLLAENRASLRAGLKKMKQDWLDDPANGDESHLRVRVRKVIPQLEKAGVEVAHVAASMAALRRADAALGSVADQWWNGNTRAGRKDVAVDAVALRQLPDELGLRVLARVQESLLPGQMPVRSGKRLALLQNIRQKPTGKATLGGIVWLWNGQGVLAKAEHPAK